MDGNDPLALAAAGAPLLANGLPVAPEAYAVVDLASGKLAEEELTRWLRASVQPVE